MTAVEKMKTTRAKNREAWEEKERQRLHVYELMKGVCVRVLEDPEASSEDKLTATVILHDLTKGR